jgi:hypothetical protein
MSEKSDTSVLGSLPHSRPHRRSEKRAARPEPQQTAEPKPAGKPRQTAKPKPAAKPKRAAAAKPRATTTRAAPAPAPEQAPPKRPDNPASLPQGTELVGTVVKAAAELAEIGLTVGARALRTAVSRLPHP